MTPIATLCPREIALCAGITEQSVGTFAKQGQYGLPVERLPGGERRYAIEKIIARHPQIRPQQFEAIAARRAALQGDPSND